MILQLREPLGVDPEGLLHALMAAISHTAQVPLLRGDPQLALQPGTWAEGRNGHGLWDGRVRIQTATPGDLQAVDRVIRSYVVELHGEQRLMEAFGPSLPTHGPAAQHQRPAPGNGAGAGM